QSIRHIMDQHAGLFRDQQGLDLGLQQLDPLLPQIQKLPVTTLALWLQQRRLYGLWLQAKIILRAARLRSESRGAHQRRDYPKQDDNHWRLHLAWSLPSQSSVPVVARLKVQTEL